MRIISGSARGRKLIAPEGEQTRPTAEAVKEALFSIIQFRIEGKRVLDLFAGSGQLGLEALSRGAEVAVMVDCRRESVDIIRKNVAATGFDSRAQVICSDFVPFLRGCTPQEFDIIFLDPPYGGDMLNSALDYIFKLDILSSDGLIICESARKDEIKINGGCGKVVRDYFYGKKKLTLIERKRLENEDRCMSGQL